MPQKPYYSKAIRAQVLTLKSLGIPTKEIKKITKIYNRAIQRTWKKALEEGYDPMADPALKD